MTVSPPLPQDISGPQPSLYNASFQKHYDQLDQEYDAQAEMIDEVEGDGEETEQYIPNFRMPDPNSTAMPRQHASNIRSANQGFVPAVTQAFDPFDPMLDADPFGLTASMHFPTPFGYDNGPNRR